MLYLERIQKRGPHLQLTSWTLQRLLLVAALVASKYLDDIVCLNTYWAELGGLTIQELNTLELEFLFAIDFDLAVHPHDYVRCVESLHAFRRERPEFAGGDGPLEAAAAQAWATGVAARAVATQLWGGKAPSEGGASPSPRGPSSPEPL